MKPSEMTTVELLLLTADGEMDEDYRRVLRSRAERLREAIAAADRQCGDPEFPRSFYVKADYEQTALRAINAPSVSPSTAGRPGLGWSHRFEGDPESPVYCRHCGSHNDRHPRPTGAAGRSDE